MVSATSRLATLFALVLVTAADETTVINSSENWGIWEGWGVSLAWWAKAFGTHEELADIFFSDERTNYNGQDIAGLWLNIARYNAGACSFNPYDGQSMVQSPDIDSTRQMDAYWTDWASTDPSSTSWNWTVDANQRNMMRLAQKRGANIFELFSNSPVWWMCLNHNPSGSDDGSSDNLQSWNYEQHALYLATIAQHASKNWGVDFQSVEAFNEPIADYWVGPTGTQEGCHFDVSTQATVIGYLRSELDSHGLSHVLVSASDENTYDEGVSTWDGLGSTATSQVGRINVHGYEEGSGQRGTLYELASQAGKRLWNSEYGEDDATGQSLISNLMLDLRLLHPTAWVYWQAIDVPGWGLIDGDNDGQTLGNVSQKYFVLSQFTRHIRPGMQILDGGSNYTVAAYDRMSQTLVIVAVNWGDAQYINFDLSQFASIPKARTLVPRWATQVGSGQQYASHHDTFFSGTKFWSYFDSMVIQTFEVPNVKL